MADPKELIILQGWAQTDVFSKFEQSPVVQGFGGSALPPDLSGRRLVRMTDGVPVE